MRSTAEKPRTVGGRHCRARVLGAGDGAVCAARDYVRLTLEAWGMPGLAEDAKLIVSELATNAVRYADGIMIVQCSLSDCDRFVMEVWDPSAELPKITNGDRFDVHGRGLAIVEALADDWGAHRLEDGGKIVWAALYRG